MKKKLVGYYLLGIFLSLSVLIVIYIIKDISPFGDNSFLTIDFYHQYGPMLGGMYKRIFNFENLLYSFNSGMGLPIYLNFMNYLASPFNLLILLFDFKGLLTSFSFIIGLKTVASVMTMLFFFKEKFGLNFRFIPLAILYAFSAYFVAYYWNIMWIDGMYMLPLIAIGIERLADKNRPLLYIFSLSFMLLINYFIGYMLCIFSLLYFIMYFFIKLDNKSKKKNIKIISNYIISSLIAGGLCAFILIPLFFSLKNISATGDAFPNYQYYAFTLKEFLLNHLSYATSTVLKSGKSCAPNLSCGIMIVLLLVMFFFNKKIDLRVKIGYTLFLIILIFSFVMGPIDYIWHAMHVPNDLPFRYSFIYSFILIVIGGYAIKDIKELNINKMFICYGLCLIFLGLINYHDISNKILNINFAFLTIYVILLIGYKLKPKMSKLFLSLIILGVSFDVSITLNKNWQDFTGIRGIYNEYDKVEEALSSIREDNEIFYRINALDTLNFNDSIWYNYYGTVAFSSMQYEDLAKLNYRLGLPGNDINSFYYKNNTPILDIMYDIKYVMGPVVDNYEFGYLDTIGDRQIYKSNYKSSLMYGVNSNINSWIVEEDRPFLNQNMFIQSATGVKDVLEKIDIINEELLYENDGKKIIRIDFLNNYDNYYVYYHRGIDFAVIEDTMYHSDSGYEYAYSRPEFSYNSEEVYGEKYIINKINDSSSIVSIYVGCSDIDSLQLYRLNRVKFEDAYQILRHNMIKLTNFRESNIKGNGFFDKNMTVFTSIPYDKGWKVYVDGRKVNSHKIGNALLGFNVTKGNHVIELKYRIPYFNVGLIVSIISIVGLLIVKKKNM